MITWYDQLETLDAPHLRSIIRQIMNDNSLRLSLLGVELESVRAENSKLKELLGNRIVGIIMSESVTAPPYSPTTEEEPEQEEQPEEESEPEVVFVDRGTKGYNA